jgi:hypothetical protein
MEKRDLCLFLRSPFADFRSFKAKTDLTRIMLRATRFLLSGSLFLLFTAVSQAQPGGAAGNGVTNDTVALQNDINALPANGILDGKSKTYLVGTLNLKSNMTLQNFNFITQPTNAPFTAPVTLNGLNSPIANVTIVNVNINGNRSQQTNLATLEDGGRSGFRIVGHVQSVSIANSSATYCATDGIEIFSGDGGLSGNDNNLNFSNIHVTNSNFSYNRRHGASGDSLSNVTFSGDTFNNNGLDINQATAEGDRGARNSSGLLYGDGVDIEGYGLGSGIDGLAFTGATAIGNSRFAIQFWDQTNPYVPGFVVRQNISITNSTLSAGATAGGQAVQWSLPISQCLTVPYWQNISLSANAITGTIVVLQASVVTVAGGTVKSPYQGFYGISYCSTGVTTQNVSAGGDIFAVM